jgi:PEP-CTERM motif
MQLNVISLAAAGAAALALALPSTASAGLVYDSSILAPAQGFGTAPRDLTLQATGQDSFESGGLGWDGTALVFGSVLVDETQVFMANGVVNQSGTTSLPSPLADDQKYGVPTTGALGITTASQIAVLFNATEPAGNGVGVTDLTLKFYSSAGSFLGAIDGGAEFATSNPGNGVAGFTFVIDAAQQATVDGWLAIGGAGTRLALEASITGYSGGPETFLIYNLSPDTLVASIPEPGTYALMFAGLGVVGFVARRRRTA